MKVTVLYRLFQLHLDMRMLQRIVIILVGSMVNSLLSLLRASLFNYNVAANNCAQSGLSLLLFFVDKRFERHKKRNTSNPADTRRALAIFDLGSEECRAQLVAICVVLSFFFRSFLVQTTSKPQPIPLHGPSFRKRRQQTHLTDKKKKKKKKKKQKKSKTKKKKDII